MHSLIAVLTFNRRKTLEACLHSLKEHCPGTPVAIFEDGGFADDTVDWLTRGRVAVNEDKQSECIEYAYGHPFEDSGTVDGGCEPLCTCGRYEHEHYDSYRGAQVFIGTANLGVAGNSNRAIRYFLKSGADHLLLCNDDILATGNFVPIYAKAHQKLNVQLFCRSDIENAETGHGWMVVNYRGEQVRISTRLTGNMMSMTRKCVQEIGFFDTSFGMLGNEHCDVTYRASKAGLIRLDNVAHTGLDIDHELLTLQNVPSSVNDRLKGLYQHQATTAMAVASERYTKERYFRPFSTRHIPIIGSSMAGVPAHLLYGSVMVNDFLSIPATT